MSLMRPSSPSESPFDWPAFGLDDDVRPALAAAMARGDASVLATLYGVEGGAPRGIGAQMLIAEAGLSGFLSGGCIEADVAAHARAVLADGAPRHLVYGDGGPADIKLPCGSSIRILLEHVAADDPAAKSLLDLTAARRPALWLTDGRRRACAPQDLTGPVPEGFDDLVSFPPPLLGVRDDGLSFALARAFRPPLRLVIVGGDPTALALVRLATTMGIETTLIRPKGPALPPEGVRYVRDAADAALRAIAPDPWTAIAVLTHDVEQEHEALSAALAGEAGYVGVLGSRRRIPERNRRLRSAGVPDHRIAAIRSPIGLAGGGKSPWDIALSIMAEITAETTAAEADHRPLRDGLKGPSSQTPAARAASIR